jgi:hypothetical protein
MGDENEESQECLSGLAERSCMFFVLYMNYTRYVYFYIVYEL